MSTRNKAETLAAYRYCKELVVRHGLEALLLVDARTATLARVRMRGKAESRGRLPILSSDMPMYRMLGRVLMAEQGD